MTNFRPGAADLDYPGKLQQQQDGASEQTPLTQQQNGNPPVASVPQQNTDSQVGVCTDTLLLLSCSICTLHLLDIRTAGMSNRIIAQQTCTLPSSVIHTQTSSACLGTVPAMSDRPLQAYIASCSYLLPWTLTIDRAERMQSACT